MNLYELREVPYDRLKREVDVLTFYADSDETAIITATIHPFRLTVLELNRIISENDEKLYMPTVVGWNREKLLDKETMVNHLDYSGTEKTIKNENVYKALNSHMRMTPRQRIYYEEMKNKMDLEMQRDFICFVKMFIAVNEDFIRDYADNIKRREMYSKIFYNGFIGITS